MIKKVLLIGVGALILANAFASSAIQCPVLKVGQDYVNGSYYPEHGQNWMFIAGSGFNYSVEICKVGEPAVLKKTPHGYSCSYPGAKGIAPNQTCATSQGSNSFGFSLFK